MSSPFALKFLGKKPFTKKTVNPEAGGKDYEAMGDAARKREQKLSAETGGVDYEAKLKVQKEMSPLNGAYASGAGGSVYVSTAGAFQDLQNKISAGIQADLAKKNKKKKDKEISEAFKSFSPSTTDFELDTNIDIKPLGKN
jgi:hypothetical protein